MIATYQWCLTRVARLGTSFLSSSTLVIPGHQEVCPIQRWGIYPWARRTHCPNGFNSQCPISIHCPPTVNPSGPSSHQLGMLYDNTLQTHLYLTNIFRIVTIYGTDASSRVCLKSSNFIQSSWHKNTEKYKKAPRQVLVN